MASLHPFLRSRHPRLIQALTQRAEGSVELLSDDGLAQTLMNRRKIIDWVDAISTSHNLQTQTNVQSDKLERKH